MIELLASLLVGALIAEWWETYHTAEPPPAVSAPPPKRTKPVMRTDPVALPREVATAESAPAATPRAITAAPESPAAVRRPKPTTGKPATLIATEPPAPAGTAVVLEAPPPPSLRLTDQELATRATALAAGGEHLLAAADHAEALRRHPDDIAARHALVLALQAGGLPELAIDFASEAPASFTPSEWAALHADAAAEAIALAIRGEPRPERTRLLRERAAAALATADGYAEAQRIGAAQDRVASLRISLLHGTGRFRDAALAYKQALAAGRTLDDAAHTGAALSLLATSEVDAADEAFARRSAQAPAVPTWESDRLFARERLRDATAVLARQVAGMPVHIRSEDGSVSQPNWDRLVAEESRLRALAWRGRLDDAIAAQEALVAGAPANVNLRLQLATFYRYDGRLDKADAEMDKAAALDPRSRELLDTRISNAIEDGDYLAARRHLAALGETRADDDDSRDLARTYDLATAPWLEATLSSTHSRGPGLATPTDELQQSVTFYGHAWTRRGDTRLFVFEEGEMGEYVGSTSSPLRIGAGVLTRHRDWNARLALHARRSVPGDGVGASLDGHVRFNDHWEADAGLQSDSDETPLLALENGIDGRSVDTALQYNVGTGHYYRLGGRRLELSDDNRSTAFSLEGRQPLYADEPHNWSLLERIDTESNDLTTVPYFSPQRMSSAELQVEYRGVLHALGDERWEHAITLGAGASEQTGFGRDGIADIRWEHDWTLNDRVGIGAGIEWRRRVYDGIDEDQTEIFASLLWRLP